MAVTDLAQVRPRIGVRIIPIALASAALFWTAYITALFARDAYRIAEEVGLLNGLHLGPELTVLLLTAAVSVVSGLVVSLTAPRALPALKLLAVAAALVAMATLAVTSHQIVEVLVFAGLLAWSWLVGSPLLWVVDPAGRILSGWPRQTIAIGLGLAVLSYSILAVALAGLLTDGGIVALLVGLPLLAALMTGFLSFRPGVMGDGPQEPEPLDVPAQALEYVALALLGITVVVSFGASLAPQTHFDALHYHFAMPSIFLAEGRFVERPDIIQGYFPLGLEMAYVPALRFGGESTMTLLHWAMAPMMAALLWGAGNRLFGRPAGAIAACALVLAPLITWEAPGASSDLAMTFWLLAAGVALSAYARHPQVSLALAGGLFTGLAVTFKIVAGIYVIPLVFVFAAAALIVGHDLPSRLRQSGAFATGGVLAGAPWLVVRFVQTGNPVFPLYNDFFESDKWPPIREKFDLWLYGIGHGPGDLARVWWEVALNPERFGQWQPAWAIGIPVLVFGAVLAGLPHLHRDRGRAVLLALALATAVSWFFLSQYHRYGLPAFGLMALVGGSSLWLALRLLPHHMAAVFGAALVSVWFGAGIALGLVMSRPDPFPSEVVFGRESREAYRDRAIPHYDALRFLEKKTRGTDEGAGLLGYPYNYFVLNRVYDSILPAELSPFRRIAGSGLPPDAMARELLEERIHWLLIDYRPPPGYTTWPPDWLAKSLLSEAFVSAHTEVAFEKQGVIVYRIIDSR